MAALNEVRDRIKSVKSTQQITKAMKLVSASKLKKSTTRIVQMRPYADKLQEVLINILDTIDVSELQMQFNQKRVVKNVLVVVLSSDRGLCGAFNANLIKSAKDIIENKYSKNENSPSIKVLPLGRKANDFFSKRNYNCISNFSEIFQDLTFENTNNISNFICNSFLNEEFDVVEVVYAKFKNAAVQEFTVEKFLPLENTKTNNLENKNNKSIDYIFEPNKENLLEEIVPKILKTTFFKYCLDNNASENGARMVAMDSATNNAGDLIKKLEIEYNKARQASITNQIMEIVGGAAALNA